MSLYSSYSSHRGTSKSDQHLLQPGFDRTLRQSASGGGAMLTSLQELQSGLAALDAQLVKVRLTVASNPFQCQFAHSNSAIKTCKDATISASSGQENGLIKPVRISKPLEQTPAADLNSGKTRAFLCLTETDLLVMIVDCCLLCDYSIFVCI